MFHAAFQNPVLTALGAAILATGLSLNPAHAGEGGGGGGGDRAGVSTASSTDTEGNTVSIRSRNNAPVYTVTRTRNGKVVSKETKRKKSKPFVTLTDENGNKRTINKVTRNRTAFMTITYPDGTTRTVTSADR
jgi:hypothetical protein